MPAKRSTASDHNTVFHRSTNRRVSGVAEPRVSVVDQKELIDLSPVVAAHRNEASPSSLLRARKWCLECILILSRYCVTRLLLSLALFLGGAWLLKKGKKMREARPFVSAALALVAFGVIIVAVCLVMSVVFHDLKGQDLF